LPHDAPIDIAELTAPGRSFALLGPTVHVDAGQLPVRGDLAHIRLAGKVFVPHYVVPLPYLVNGSGADLVAAARADAALIANLPTGTRFNVLDVAGPWAWGQAGDDGMVGYVALAALKPLV